MKRAVKMTKECLIETMEYTHAFENQTVKRRALFEQQNKLAVIFTAFE
jgi:hypothetical protein